MVLVVFGEAAVVSEASFEFGEPCWGGAEPDITVWPAPGSSASTKCSGHVTSASAATPDNRIPKTRSPKLATANPWYRRTARPTQIGGYDRSADRGAAMMRWSMSNVSHPVWSTMPAAKRLPVLSLSHIKWRACERSTLDAALTSIPTMRPPPSSARLSGHSGN